MGQSEEGYDVVLRIGEGDPNGPINEIAESLAAADPEDRAKIMANALPGLLVPSKGGLVPYRFSLTLRLD